MPSFTTTFEDTGIAVHVYRIGWWTNRWWPHAAMLKGALLGRQPGGRKVPRSRYLRAMRRDLKLISRPHRPWQAEYDGTRWCRRGWTASDVRRLAEEDLRHELRTGEVSPWVRSKVEARYGPMTREATASA